MSKIDKCHNIKDFRRRKAKSKLPSPVFHYIDGAADDESALKRTVKAFEQCDLSSQMLLRAVENIDLATKILGKKMSLAIFSVSPTALQIISPPG